MVYLNKLRNSQLNYAKTNLMAMLFEATKYLTQDEDLIRNREVEQNLPKGRGATPSESDALYHRRQYVELLERTLQMVQNRQLAQAVYQEALAS